jgi:hypothetical protein
MFYDDLVNLRVLCYPVVYMKEVDTVRQSGYVYLNIFTRGRSLTLENTLVIVKFDA